MAAGAACFAAPAASTSQIIIFIVGFEVQFDFFFLGVFRPPSSAPTDLASRGPVPRFSTEAL